MATKRSTFQKRQRENDLKDKARAKDARRAAKRDAANGPPQPEEDLDAIVNAAIAAAHAPSDIPLPPGWNAPSNGAASPPVTEKPTAPASTAPAASAAPSPAKPSSAKLSARR